MNQGGSVPSLTYQITGYKYTDNESSALSTGVTMTTDATSSSVAGNYYTRPECRHIGQIFYQFCGWCTRGHFQDSPVSYLGTGFLKCFYQSVH